MRPPVPSILMLGAVTAAGCQDAAPVGFMLDPLVCPVVIGTRAIISAPRVDGSVR